VAFSTHEAHTALDVGVANVWVKDPAPQTVAGVQVLMMPAVGWKVPRGQAAQTRSDVAVGLVAESWPARHEDAALHDCCPTSFWNVDGGLQPLHCVLTVSDAAWVW